MRWIILIIPMFTMFLGCASVGHVPLTADVAKSLNGKIIHRSQYTKADFSAITAGNVITSSFIQEGNKIVEINYIDDPAVGISEKIIVAMSEKYGLSMLEEQNTYSDPDLILGVKTLAWGFNYYRTDWNNYRIFYRSRLRLIGENGQKIIAEGECYYEPKYANTNDSPSYDDLINNNAKGLKNEFAKAALYCEEFFKGNVLKF